MSTCRHFWITLLFKGTCSLLRGKSSMKVSALQSKFNFYIDAQWNKNMQVIGTPETQEEREYTCVHIDLCFVDYGFLSLIFPNISTDKAFLPKMSQRTDVFLAKKKFSDWTMGNMSVPFQHPHLMQIPRSAKVSRIGLQMITELINPLINSLYQKYFRKTTKSKITKMA